MPLWDKAKWKGVVYIWPQDLDQEPWVALGFEEGTAAREIFTGWRAMFGDVDQESRLRISILTGVDRAKVHSYSAVVGSNLVESRGNARVKQFVSVSRILRMEPSTLRNLTGFRDRFERIGTYRVMPALLNMKTGRCQPYPGLSNSEKRDADLPSLANRRA